jgi:hypothetical protein
MKKDHLPQRPPLRPEPHRIAAMGAKVRPVPQVSGTPGLRGVLQGFFPGGGPRFPGAGAPVVQPRGAGGGAVALPSSISLPTHGGQPIPETVRRQMEAHFKTDFSAVRVHVGAHVTSLGALAFTLGDSIHFAPGHYQPESSRGQQLLGHELTHVVQQRAGRVRNPFNSGLVVVQDGALEAEAERMGLRVAASRPVIAPAVHVQRFAHPSLPAPRPLQAGHRPSPFPAFLHGRLVQPMTRKEIKAQATFLNTTATTLFNNTVDGKLMEVQSAIFDGKMFIASNYSKGADDTALRAQVAASYTHGGAEYKGGGLVRIAAGLHAEQQILYELARVLANPNKTPPSHVTVIGSKRPCSICRRVLLAFRKGLLDHYGGVNLHFVNQTGSDTAVGSLDLDALAAGADQRFKNFVATYNAELAKLAAKRFPEEIAESNAVRTQAAPDLDEIL